MQVEIRARRETKDAPALREGRVWSGTVSAAPRPAVIAGLDPAIRSVVLDDNEQRHGMDGRVNPRIKSEEPRRGGGRGRGMIIRNDPVNAFLRL